jgi:glycosyltransferase involved in cell wall biosynthesis
MLTSSYPRFEGDIAGTFVYSLAEHIAGLGHEVHVLAAYDPGSSASAGQTAGSESRSAVQVHRFRYAVGDRWHLVGYAKSLEADVTLKKEVYAMLPFYALAASYALWRWQRRVRFDVLHAHWVVPSGGVAAVVAPVVRTPLVVSLHGSDVFMLERNPVARLAARWAFSRAAQVTACSSDLLQRAQRHGLPVAKSQLVPYGVDPGRFHVDEPSARALREQLGIAADAPVVLALGRLVYKKGFEYLVRAIPEIAVRFDNVRVVIAGGGPLREDLQRLGEELGVGRHLMLVDNVPWEDTVRYFNLADVFVVPSVRDQKGNVDGLPNVVLEAMACGKPLIATRVAGLPEVVVDGRSGLLVEEKDPHGLAQAAIQLLSAPATAKGCGAANRARAEGELSWERIAMRMVEVYEQAIASRA